MSSSVGSLSLETWKLCRKRLEHSLEKVDLEKLAEELQKIDVISKDWKDKFLTVDCTVTETPTLVRYLVMHVHERVSTSMPLLRRLYRCLSEKFQLGGVLSDARSSARGAGSSSSSEDVEDHILTAEDVHLVVEQLHDVAVKWENVAIALKLSPSTRRNCSSSDCVIALANVIHEKIQGSSSPCKLRVLTDALKSKTVSCPRVVQELKDTLVRVFNTKTQSVNEEDLHRELIFDYCIHNIEINEGKSVLLEVQGAFDDNMAFRWYKDGTALSNSSEHSGVKCSILLIHKADLVQEGMYQCHINLNETELPVDGRISVRVILTPERQHLMSMYAREPEVPLNSWPPITNMEFINLVLIENWGSNEAVYKYTVRGDIDDIIDVEKKSVEYQDIFERFKEKSLILVEGRPGSGKTTLVHKISREWATEKGKVLKQARLVFFIYLRVLNEEHRSLSDILKKLFYPDPTQGEELKRVVQKIAQAEGENTCFILDGLDEYDLPSRKDTTIYRLIYKKYLPKSMVIVSSRPVATADIRQNIQGTVRIEVLGFSFVHIVQYILAYSFGERVLCSKLCTYLLNHPNVLHMCYLPVHLAMICFLYDCLRDEIPNTESKIYKEFTLLTILRYLKQNDTDSTVTSLTELNGQPRVHFRTLCKLAFNFTASSQQTQVGIALPSETQTLGLVTVDKIADIYKMKNIYAFHHLTFQEYLAARYIADLDEEGGGEGKQMELISLYAGKPHLKNMWKFYCGIVNFKSKIPQFEKIIGSYSSDSLYWVQCAFESQQSLTCQCVIKNSKDSSLDFDDQTFLPHDMSAIENVITCAACPVQLAFKNNCQFMSSFQDKELSEVVLLSITWNYEDQSKVWNNFLTKMPNISTLDLSNTKFNIAELVDGITLSNLEVLKVTLFSASGYKMSKGEMKMLKFNSSKIEEVRVDFISDDFIPYYGDESDYLDMLRCEKELCHDLCAVFGFSVVFRGQLPYIYISSFNINTFSGITSEHFSKCVNLALVDCGIGDSIAEELASNMHCCKELKHLILDFNRLSDIGAQSLAGALKTHTSLYTFSVVHNCIGDCGALLLITSLLACKEIYRLDFQCNNISVDGLKEILCITERSFLNSSLKIWNKNLDFRCCDKFGAKFTENVLDLNSKGLGLFIKYFPHMLAEHLQVLDLTCNFIQLEELSIIVQNLSICKHLKKLAMCSNLFLFGNTESNLLVHDTLKSLFLHCSEIQYLDLSNDLDFFDDLQEMGLHNLKNLQHLNLSRNGALFDLNCDGQVEEICNCSNLTTLLVNECKIESFGVINILKRCKKLKEIGLADNPDIVNSFPAIAVYLTLSSELRILNLSSNKINKACLQKLPDYVKENELLLRELIFKSNGIDEEGLAIICSLNWNSLHTLDISQNSIGCAKLEALTESLKYCFSHLNTLNISSNKIEDNAIIALSKAMANDQEGIDNESSLKTLNIKYNLIGDSSIYHLIKICICVENLDVSKNKITSLGIEIIRESSAQFKELKYDDENIKE